MWEKYSRFFSGNFKYRLKNNFLFPQFYQTFIPYLNLFTLPKRQKKKKKSQYWEGMGYGLGKIVFYELIVMENVSLPHSEQTIYLFSFSPTWVYNHLQQTRHFPFLCFLQLLYEVDFTRWDYEQSIFPYPVDHVSMWSNVWTRITYLSHALLVCDILYMAKHNTVPHMHWKQYMV